MRSISIIDKLANGDVKNCDMKLPENRLENEMRRYKAIKKTVGTENEGAFEEYAVVVADNYEYLVRKAYALGLRTGFMLGCEITETDTEEI